MLVEAVNGMYERVVVQTVLCGSETWEMNTGYVCRVEVDEVRCLRST